VGKVQTQTNLTKFSIISPIVLKNTGGYSMTKRFLKRPEVERMTALSRSSIYDKMAKDEFPKPLKIGQRSVAWYYEDIEAWMLERIAISKKSQGAEHGQK
jgi:prophage regulatory protein